MLGLRTAGDLAGFTRLCDEFLLALDHLHEDGFADASRAIAHFDRALRRVRSFARGGEAVEGFTREESGLLLFELQGYDYAASVGFVELRAADAFDTLRAPLEAEAARAASAVVGEQVPIGLLIARVTGVDDGVRPRLLAEARANDFTHALAYAFPREEEAWAPRSEGVMLLGKRP